MKVLKKLAKWYLIVNTILVYLIFGGICADYGYRRRRNGQVDMIRDTSGMHKIAFKNAKFGWKKWWDFLKNAK